MSWWGDVRNLRWPSCLPSRVPALPQGVHQLCQDPQNGRLLLPSPSNQAPLHLLRGGHPSGRLSTKPPRTETSHLEKKIKRLVFLCWKTASDDIFLCLFRCNTVNAEILSLCPVVVVVKCFLQSSLWCTNNALYKYKYIHIPYLISV